MRRLALLVLLASCAEDAPPEKPRPPAPPPIAWSRTQFLDLELHVPKEWIAGHAVQGDSVFFPGPEADGGWRPELQFGWKLSRTSLDDWASARIRYLESLPVGSVLEQGTTTVAGMPARFFVYGFERQAEGQRQMMREINFYFAGHGCIGFVRGVCTARTYPRYLPIYREAAARVVYKPL